MRKGLFVFLCIGTMLLSGCWDMRELNELAIVMAVGVDKDPLSNNFIVTAQIARPGGAAQGEGESGSGDGVWTATAEGDTIFAAIRNLAKFSSRRIMWAHNHIVIIGESLARENITPVVDFFTHNPELRMKTWVAVAKGDAKDYMAIKTGLENIPGMSLSRVFRYAGFPAISVGTEMLHLFADILSDSTQPLIAGLRMVEGEIPMGNAEDVKEVNQIELSGGAVFKETKMLGWLEPEEVRGVRWIRNEINNAVVTVPHPAHEEKKISVEIKRSNTQLVVSMENEIPSIHIGVKGVGEITEEGHSSTLTIEELKKEVVRELQEKIEKEIIRGISRVQREFESDVLGFGKAIHIQHKNVWNEEIKDMWEELFPVVPITVEVHMDIRSSSLYQRPIRIPRKGE